MTDPLGEALARLDRTKAPNIYRPDIEPIVAAARNWHALTNPTGELIDRVAQILADQDTVLVEDAPEIYLPLARAVVDALTDTAEPPMEDDDA